MSPAHLGRTLRTLRHLRPGQWYGQVRRRVLGPVRPRRASGPPPVLCVPRARVAFLPPAAHAAESAPGWVRLLERPVRFPDVIDWGYGGEGPLWTFHLHYHEWLRGAGLPAAARLAILRDWIARHPGGVGWGPAPTSLRAFQWAKLLLTAGALPDDEGMRAELSRSLADQLATLRGALEHQLGANHLLFNLLALVLGGVLLDGSESDRWLALEAPLRSELGDQVGRDGAHYERSPMYHALVLEAVLDLLNVADARPGRLADVTRETLRDTAARMRGALSLWTHPDGEIALFGDAAFGIAPPPAALHRYAEALGVAERGPATPGVLGDAGFVRLEAGALVLIASVAGPSPAHQPGHAHCDALAFELSVAGERVITDTGVSEYVPGPLRDASRATRSHATLEVDGSEQAELWAAHRVGGRPAVRLVHADAASLEATCAGWATRDVVHRRRLRLGEAALEIEDVLEGRPGRTREVVSSLPLAPGTDVHLEGATATLRTPRGARLTLALPEALAWSVETTAYQPRFGASTPRPHLRGHAAALRPGAVQLARVQHDS